MNSGQFVFIAVSDAGTGMDVDVAKALVFYTTKGVVGGWLSQSRVTVDARITI